MENRKITLVSDDRVEFKIPVGPARLCELFDTLCKNADLDEVCREKHIIELKEATEGVVRKVVEFLEHCYTDPMAKIERPLIDDNIENILTGWYLDFIKMPDLTQQERDDTIFKMIVVADFLNVAPLRSLCAATVASMLRMGVSDMEGFKKRFNITDSELPKTEAEELELRQRYSELFDLLEVTGEAGDGVETGENLDDDGE